MGTAQPRLKEIYLSCSCIFRVYQSMVQNLELLYISTVCPVVQKKELGKNVVTVIMEIQIFFFFKGSDRLCNVVELSMQCCEKLLSDLRHIKLFKDSLHPTLSFHSSLYPTLSFHPSLYPELSFHMNMLLITNDIVY